MSNQDKHITHWSPSDVQKYLKGELSAREMHRLERAALEDPFLADAIEGLSQYPPAPLANDLDDLQSRLAARVSKKKRPIGWIKMAVAIVLLVGLGFTAWYVLLDNSKAKSDQSVARQMAPEHRAAEPPATRDAEPPEHRAAQPPISNAAATDTVRPQSDLIAAGPSPAKAAPPPYKAKTHIRITASVTQSDIPKSTADSLDILLKNQVSSLDITPAQANRMVLDSVKIGKLIYAGQVLDLNNRPLANASLLVSGPSNAVTTTNALGQFKLNLRPQDTSQHLTVALAGYENAYLAVNRLNSDAEINNTIILRERPAVLNEVVVSSMGRRAKEAFATAPFDDKSEKLDSFWVKVTPVTGRPAYLDYLATAKTTLSVDTSIQGAEIVSFAIDPKGTPIDFKIEHSLSPAHDAGVVRLITDGARWKILRGKNIRALVQVSFP